MPFVHELAPCTQCAAGHLNTPALSITGMFEACNVAALMSWILFLVLHVLTKMLSLMPTSMECCRCYVLDVNMLEWTSHATHAASPDDDPGARSLHCTTVCPPPLFHSSLDQHVLIQALTASECLSWDMLCADPADAFDITVSGLSVPVSMHSPSACVGISWGLQRSWPRELLQALAGVSSSAAFAVCRFATIPWPAVRSWSCLGATAMGSWQRCTSSPWTSPPGSGTAPGGRPGSCPAPASAPHASASPTIGCSCSQADPCRCQSRPTLPLQAACHLELCCLNLHKAVPGHIRVGASQHHKASSPRRHPTELDASSSMPRPQQQSMSNPELHMGTS